MSGPAVYHLSRHAFACMAGRYYVFLDLLRDLYFSVPREDLDELAPWIHGVSLASRTALPTGTRLSAAATALAAELVAAGVLKEGPPEEGFLARLAPTPLSDLASARGSLDPAGRRRRLFMDVAASMAYARWALRSTAMYSIVETIGERKRAPPAAGTKEWRRAAELTQVFLHYRPLFPWDYRCLFDSLALIRFLSRFNLYADWVFGVQDDPFSAHCWVQAGAQVLNDDLEHVRSYTPIMTI
jgi:Transglutaminase-like superfamily